MSPETNAAPTTARILILFAHPAMQKSRVNRRLIDAVQDLDGVTIHDLYEAYPRYDIDVPREQALLEAHDLIVFQHPFYWYSTPSIIKEWQDLVLEHGWAYGAKGRALHGKRWLQVTTTGAPEEAYCAEGRMHFTARQLLAPLEQTARLCGMRFLAPFVLHNTHSMDETDIAAPAQDYRELLIALRDGLVDLEALEGRERINGPRDCRVTDGGS